MRERERGEISADLTDGCHAHGSRQGLLWTCDERHAWRYTDCDEHCDALGFARADGCITAPEATFCLCDGGAPTCSGGR